MDLQVDRLTLRLAALSDADGRRLPHLVAEQLALASPSLPAGVVSQLRITIDAKPGEHVESLARRIAAEMLRRLAREL